MGKKDNIEELLKETFEHFEADVNPKAWETIQSQLTLVSAASTSSSVAAKLGIAKLIGGVITAAAIAGAAIYFVVGGNKDTILNKDKVNPLIQEEQPINTAEDIQKEAVTVEELGKKEQSITVQNELFTNESKAEAKKYESNHTIPANIPSVREAEKTVTTESKSIVKDPLQTTVVSTPADNPLLMEYRVSEKNPMSFEFWVDKAEGNKFIWTMDGKELDEHSSVLNYTFDKAGEHEVAVRLAGESKNLVQTVGVDTISSIQLPNVFSPNGDGTNDLFVANVKNITEYHIVISTRASQKVFESTTPEENWDGTDLSSTPLPDGTYFYKITALGTDGVRHLKASYVTLRK